jgi:hypothetical protein
MFDITHIDTDTPIDCVDDGTYNIDAKTHGSNVTESPTTQPKTPLDPSLLPTLALKKKKFVAHEPLKTSKLTW